MAVQLEKDMDPEALKRFREYLGPKEPTPLKVYDEMGLRFPLDWLRELGVSLVLLPLEWQANYVDKVTYLWSEFPRDVPIGSPEESIAFCESQLEAAEMLRVEEANATSIGNLAYMALYAYEARHREKAIAILNRIQEYVVEQAKHQQN